eukprot:1545042-Rhodomonas_salina.1
MLVIVPALRPDVIAIRLLFCPPDTRKHTIVDSEIHVLDSHDVGPRRPDMEPADASRRLPSTVMGDPEDPTVLASASISITG